VAAIVSFKVEDTVSTVMVLISAINLSVLTTLSVLIDVLFVNTFAAWVAAVSLRNGMVTL
jgi:hypothetical protein